MTVRRAFANILSDRLSQTRDFYVELLGFTVAYETEWLVRLQVPGQPLNTLGIWQRNHELVPEEARGAPGGTILTFVVGDVAAVHKTAVERGIPVVEPPRYTFYGQHSMLLRDPNGQIVEVSAPVLQRPGRGGS